MTVRMPTRATYYTAAKRFSGTAGRSICRTRSRWTGSGVWIVLVITTAVGRWGVLSLPAVNARGLAGAHAQKRTWLMHHSSLRLQGRSSLLQGLGIVERRWEGRSLVEGSDECQSPQSVALPAKATDLAQADRGNDRSVSERLPGMDIG